MAIWNPPLLDENLGVRGSALAEAAELFSELIASGARTICFMKSRKGVELILRHARDRLDDELAERIAPYRAGYTPAQRQDIQRRLTQGELLGVVATDALELGIDIGELDAAICVTFPGTVASLRQMWGRAGRRGRGLAVYIAGEDALDQFFCRHPDEFLGRPVESAILDPGSPEIYGEHLLCAAHEAPLTDADEPFLGAQWREFATDLADAGYLRERAGGFVPKRADDYPAARVALRSASADSFVLIEAGTGEVLGTIEAGRAYATVHEGAVYLHLGRSYRGARARPGGAAGAARAVRRQLLHAGQEREHDLHRAPSRSSATLLGVTLSFGRVVYSETVLGYQRKGLQDHEVIDFQSLELPTVEFPTRALWYELDELIASEPFPAADLLGALHALEHGQIAVLPLIAMCDRWDIGGLSTNLHPQTGGPTHLHLRRASRRRRDHPPRLRPVRAARRRRGAADRRVPVQVRLPVVRAVAQVRQPQRAAVQARRARAARAPAGAGYLTAKASIRSSDLFRELAGDRLRAHVRRQLRGPGRELAPGTRERERGQGPGGELLLDRREVGALGHAGAAGREPEHEQLHRRVVADHHHRAGVLGDAPQALEHVRGAGGVQLGLDRNLATRLHTLERLARAARRRADHQLRSDVLVAEMLIEQADRTPAARGERTLVIIKTGVVPARLGVAQYEQSLGIGHRTRLWRAQRRTLRCRRESLASLARGEIAQLVEHTTENRGVPSSSLGLAIA